MQLMSRMDRKWFSKKWLAYIMVGNPAMWMILSTFISRGTTLSSSEKEDLNTKIRASMSKKERKRAIR